jgi:hypothetical protein
VNEPTIIAVDWSGAKALPPQRRGIVTAVADGVDVSYTTGRTRLQTIERIEQMAGPLVVGFDFSFGVPAWFANDLGCATIADVWAVAKTEGERWLGPPPTPPFWNVRNEVDRDRQFRRCEEALKTAKFPAKSLFQVVGVGMVGPGSVRGMPLLARLRAVGFAIWPFDPPGERTVVEIYPTTLRPLAPTEYAEREYATNDIRDAVLSAAVMWEHREEFAMLPVTTDDVNRLEGDVWLP